MYISLFISVVIGILINLIGNNYPLGTNDVLINPALITLIVKGLEFYTKNNKYADFLKSFGITLSCFAFFGSWIFHYIKPIRHFILVTKNKVSVPDLDRNSKIEKIKDKRQGSSATYMYIRR